MAVLTRLIDAMSAKSTTAESKKEAGLPVSLVRLAIAVSHLARERVMMMTLLVVGSAANWIAHSNPRPTLAPVIAIVLILFSFLLVFAVFFFVFPLSGSRPATARRSCYVCCRYSAPSKFRKTNIKAKRNHSDFVKYKNNKV